MGRRGPSTLLQPGLLLHEPRILRSCGRGGGGRRGNLQRSMRDFDRATKLKGKPEVNILVKRGI